MTTRAQINLEKIIEVSTNICNQEGYNQLSLALVSKSLGIKTPSLYNYIENLAELRELIAIEGLKQMYDFLLHAIIGLTGEDAIMQASIAYVDFVLKAPGLYQAISSVPNPYDSKFDALSTQFVHLFLKLLDSYNLTKTDSIYAVRGLRSLLHGFASIQTDIGFRLEYSQKDSLVFMVRTYLKGLQ